MPSPNEILKAKLALARNKINEAQKPQETETKIQESQASNTVQTGEVQISNSDTGILQSTKINPAHPLAMKLAELQQSLEEKIPGFAHILRDIHKSLREDPACVTSLSKEEIGLLVRGLKEHGNITIVDNKAKGSKSKRSQPLAADML